MNLEDGVWYFINIYSVGVGDYLDSYSFDGSRVRKWNGRDVDEVRSAFFNRSRTRMV